MILKKNIRKIILHIIAWGLFVFLNFLLLKSEEVEFNIGRQIKLLSIYLVVFYSFYLFIAPLLFKKRILIFIFTSIILITGAVFINNSVQEKYHEKRIEELRNNDKLKMDVIHENDRLRPPRRPPIEIMQKVERPPFVKKNFKLIESSMQILFFVFISLLLRFTQKWQYDEKTRYILEKEKSDAELLFLKQQINPHFLFNSLNSIYSLANKKSDLTTEAVLKLSFILRYVLYHSREDQVPLTDELTTLENYIELQRLRITEKVKLDYIIEGDPSLYFIEPLLMMPIFENAFKYGVDSITESFIRIYIKIKNGKLNLEISNKIIPLEIKNKEESGIGLENIKRRLELLYPDSYYLNIYEEKQIFYVKLNIKLKK